MLLISIHWTGKINPTKSAIIVTNDHHASNSHTRHMDGEPINVVSSHKHLGIMRTSDPGHDHAADAITKGYRAFYALVGTSPFCTSVMPPHCSKALDDIMCATDAIRLL